MDTKSIFSYFKFLLFGLSTITILSGTIGAGYYIYQQNQQIKVLGEQISSLKEDLPETLPLSPAITPSPSPSPIQAPIVKAFNPNDYPPGEAPAQEPTGKQQALIEIDAKIAENKAFGNKLLEDCEKLENGPYAPYCDPILKSAKEVAEELNELERLRLQILAQ